ncbi:hypothetical protein [Nocardioides sp. GY 10127]|uniref:hypothetical protein n=1 Tax=Nocardioides sp. GY 10127 TaxID=2569762 RepID=UPI0010A86481|nr:hypothetical protein [Nocardioides sp. GY 10127]TIC81777.1 hypothetical protein E8D37_11370 [Nocardioides sp. GY 10127]
MSDVVTWTLWLTLVTVVIGTLLILGMGQSADLLPFHPLYKQRPDHEAWLEQRAARVSAGEAHDRELDARIEGWARSRADHADRSRAHHA